MDDYDISVLAAYRIVDAERAELERVRSRYESYALHIRALCERLGTDPNCWLFEEHL